MARGADNARGRVKSSCFDAVIGRQNIHESEYVLPRLSKRQRLSIMTLAPYRALAHPSPLRYFNPLLTSLSCIRVANFFQFSSVQTLRMRGCSVPVAITPPATTIDLNTSSAQYTSAAGPAGKGSSRITMHTATTGPIVRFAPTVVPESFALGDRGGSTPRPLDGSWERSSHDPYKSSSGPSSSAPKGSSPSPVSRLARCARRSLRTRFTSSAAVSRASALASSFC